MNCYNDYGGTCNGGSNDGQVCADGNDCPGGTCDKDGKFNWCCPGAGRSGAQSCPYAKSTYDYGINYNTTSNKISGWAWSDRAGWICFGETCQNICLGGTNDGECCDDAVNCPGATCPDGLCGGKPPHGRAKSWACVGMPNWVSGEFTCSGDYEDEFSNPADLKGHWKLNDIGSGGTVSDEIGSNTGNLMPDYSNTNAPIQTWGKFGNALKFDGEDDYIEVADSSGLSVEGNESVTQPGLSVEAWVKRGSIGTGTTGAQTILGKWDETTGAEKKSYRLWFDVNNKLNFAVGVGTTAAESTITQRSKCIGGNNSYDCTTNADCSGVCIRGTNNGADCTINTDCTGGGICDIGICKNPPITDLRKWHHVAGKYISSGTPNAPELRLFIDGEWNHLATTSATVPLYSLEDWDQKLYLGAKKGAAGMAAHFSGLIDNVSVWSKAKTGNQIWDASKKEVSGWARAVGMGKGGWLNLRGFTRSDRVWGTYLRDYGFYVFGGYMAERHNNEAMDTTNLIAHWKMNEAEWDGTTGEVVDSSTTGTNTGTAQGTTNGTAAPTTKGIFGNAADFDGEDDYLEIADSTGLNFTDEFTIQAWIYLDAHKNSQTDPGQHIINKTGGGAGERQYTLEIRGWGNADWKKICIGIRKSNDSAWVFATDSIDFPTEEWVFVAATYDKDASPSLRLYRNGELVGSDNTYSGLIQTGGARPLRISNVDAYFDGRIDNVALFSQARTPAQISSDYAQRLPYSMGWGDYDYDDPPEPEEFDTLALDNSTGCDLISATWDLSTWAESYSYWREQCDEGDCSSDCKVTEYSVLSDECDESGCAITDTGLTANAGYCYNVVAHNETGDTTITNNPPTNSAPQWISTVLCVPTGPDVDAATCGQMTPKWDRPMVCSGGTEDGDDCTQSQAFCTGGGGTCIEDTSVDGYNIYRTLTSTGCNTLISSTCELIGHLAEGMDYDADNDETKDLAGHWKMNESSWGTPNCSDDVVTDSSTQSNHGKSCPNNTGPVGGAAGIFDKAGSFDGTDDYIEIVDSSSLSITGDLVLQAWIKRGSIGTGTTGEQTVLGKWDESAGERAYRLWLDVNNKLNLSIATASVGTITQDVASLTDITQWHHVAGKYVSGSSPGLNLWVDGEAVNGTVTGTVPTAMTDESQALYLGAKMGSSSIDTKFNGLLDNMAVYSAVKTPEQIKVDYEAGSSGTPSYGLTNVCHIVDQDTRCGKDMEDPSTCCYTDKRIIPFTDYYYVMTAISEAGESSGSTAVSGQTICFPAPEEEEE